MPIIRFGNLSTFALDIVLRETLKDASWMSGFGITKLKNIYIEGHGFLLKLEDDNDLLREIYI